MTWRNVRLIYAREIRDQLRDRRTLFMIAVLPMLLYPLLGMSVFQLSQFLRKHESRVLVVGAQQLARAADSPQLFSGKSLAVDVIGNPSDAERIALEFRELEGNPGKAVAGASEGQESLGDDAQILARSRLLLDEGFDAVVFFPPGFADRLVELQLEARASRSEAASATEGTSEVEVPQPVILFNSASDKSRVTQLRMERVLEHWRSLVARQNLMQSRMPINIARPFSIAPHDIAEKRQRDALMWSKLLPFVLFVWALTGAFYPSVDLCPGEKERGTLETLLSSPALRGEIVWGKLFTIMTFSIATALLNLVSLGLTARYVISQLRSMAPFADGSGLSFPPLLSMIWLLIALVPMAALFSALCLACAAFARSTKEGQYYFMPLFMITMPLMMLPMSPGVELDLGNSLIPVTGVVLLLRSLIEGHYASAWPYAIPVVGMTALCCLLAIRWAIEQFQQESVLFRESERFDLRHWIIHLVRDRTSTPLAVHAFACVALILVVQFFVKLAVSANVPHDPDFRYLTLVVFISQVVCIAMPALLMTMFLTSRPWKTLMLDGWPSPAACGAAIVLAALLHPVGQQLVVWIAQLYPVGDDVVASSRSMVQILERAPRWWMPFALIALLPAVCEELAFRGFILSGFRRLGHKWWAIGLSAVFFGLAHTVLQQSLAAIVLGLALGFLAIQTGHLLPSMLFHLTYNSLMLLSVRWSEWLPAAQDRPAVFSWVFVEAEPGQVIYGPAVVISCALLASLVLMWLYRLPYQRSEEERIEELRKRQLRQPAAERPLDPAAVRS